MSEMHKQILTAANRFFATCGNVPQAGIHLSKMERQVPPKAVTRADLIA